ncbi:hypothetical protein C8J56DRAFT_1160072 [Mycena floridula]|nr:hypothetical protein C8J56DRAFT_1160072 [Mycena floridula]
MQSGFTCLKCGHHDAVEEYNSPELPSHLSATNDPPKPSETDFLREVLQQVDFEEEIDALEEKIALYEEMVEALTRRRDQLQETFTGAKGILSPIRLVPPEIIGEIALLALTDDGVMQGTSLDTSEGPWAYSHVCRLWRQEVLSRSSIWSNIQIFYQKGRHKEHTLSRHSVRILEIILQRSQQRPLHLSLSLLSDSSIAQDVLTKAVEHSCLWQSVALHLTPTLFSEITALESQIPLLETLCLGNSTTFSDVSPSHISQCFRDAPALRKLSVYGFHDPEKIDLPWVQITHLVQRSKAREVLSKTPNVVSLALHRGISAGAEKRLRLLHLRNLDLSSCYHSDGIPSLEHLPALEALRIRTEMLKSLPVLSSCPLRHVSVTSFRKGHSPETDQWQSFFQQLPMLQTLDLICVEHLKTSLRVLADRHLVPHLRQLILSLGASFLCRTVSLEPLVEMVQSRQPSSLDEIQLTNSPPESIAGHEEHIEALRKAGLKVLLHQVVLDIFKIMDV